MSVQQDSARPCRAVRLRRGFLIHLAAYTVVNAGLVAINLVTTPDRLWFYWPLAGWGVGILAHGTAAFLAGRHTGRE
jgi:hypothetical protein